MFFLMSVGAPTIFGPACALRTDPSGINPNAAPAPAAKPERRRNVRRSRTPEARPAAIPCKRARPADPSLRFINMCVVRSIAVYAIVVLDVIGLFVTSLDALGLRLLRRRLARKRHGRSRGNCRRSAHQEEAAPVDAGRYARLAFAGGHFGVGWLAHCDLLHVNLAACLSRHSDSAKASDSSSIKMRPTRPTARQNLAELDISRSANMRAAHGLRCRSKNRACSLNSASKSPRARPAMTSSRIAM